MAERTVFRGRYLASVRDATLELFEVDGATVRRLGTGDAPAEIAAFTVAAHAPWVVGRDPEHRQVWSWCPGAAVRTLARRTGVNDHAIASFVEIGGESLLALSQGGRLRLSGRDGDERAVLTADRPVAWATHGFVSLPGDRVAVIGNIPAEPCDMVLVVPARELVAGSEALQRALAAALAAPGGPALHDRAISLVVGPGPDDAMVVLRDPEDEEPPDADADPDELPDSWGLRGLYLRSLGDRSIVERAPWDARFRKLAAIAATARVVAVEVDGGVAIRDRQSGAITHVAGAALDPAGARLAVPSGSGWQVRALLH